MRSARSTSGCRARTRHARAPSRQASRLPMRRCSTAASRARCQRRCAHAQASSRRSSSACTKTSLASRARQRRRSRAQASRAPLAGSPASPGSLAPAHRACLAPAARACRTRSRRRRRRARRGWRRRTRTCAAASSPGCSAWTRRWQKTRRRPLPPCQTARVRGLVGVQRLGQQRAERVVPACRRHALYCSACCQLLPPTRRPALVPVHPAEVKVLVSEIAAIPTSEATALEVAKNIFAKVYQGAASRLHVTAYVASLEVLKVRGRGRLERVIEWMKGRGWSMPCRGCTEAGAHECVVELQEEVTRGERQACCPPACLPAWWPHFLSTPGITVPRRCCCCRRLLCGGCLLSSPPGLRSCQRRASSTRMWVSTKAAVPSAVPPA